VGFIWVLLARRLHIAAMPPVPILAGVYIWHLLVLPLTLGLAVLGAMVFGGKRFFDEAAREATDWAAKSGRGWGLRVEK
jgi:hypothetical protein